MEKIINIQDEQTISFRNQVDFCVGTGRMDLALQEEYLKQLALVQAEIGFRYIRGHGLFSEGMAIYHEYVNEQGETVPEYNFTYLDRVMDAYLKLNIRPFLELGFMPKQLASGSQTVFYWQGNVTPPKDYRNWQKLVTATLQHLIQRYGQEVFTWPIEVWNEPNLAGFWQEADMAEYFKLFSVTFKAVKEVDPRFQVGGPTICGVDDERWLREFLQYCQQQGIALDAVTRHFYTVSAPETCGHYSYMALRAPEESLQELTTSRKIIDSFPAFRGLPMHITEFNTSYRPDTPLHDTVKNAAYIAQLLAVLGQTSASYSYWTFGDVFEEQGVPFTPFHGGFGLVANGNIPKPTFWTFAFFKRLQGKAIYQDETCVLVKTDNGYRGVAWNYSPTELTKCFSIPESSQEYSFIAEIVDEKSGNPLKVWHDLGQPRSLTPGQQKLLQLAAQPRVESQRLQSAMLTIALPPYGVCYFELKAIATQPDRGFDAEKIGLV